MRSADYCIVPRAAGSLSSMLQRKEQPNPGLKNVIITPLQFYF